jgi:hypothetical protein
VSFEGVRAYAKMVEANRKGNELYLARITGNLSLEEQLSSMAKELDLINEVRRWYHIFNREFSQPVNMQFVFKPIKYRSAFVDEEDIEEDEEDEYDDEDKEEDFDEEEFDDLWED